MIGQIDLRSLESLLLDSRNMWVNSEEISDLVWNQFAHREQNLYLKNQITELAVSLRGLTCMSSTVLVKTVKR